jgi:hypothetical protein
MLPRELHTHLVGVRIAAPVVVIGPFNFTESSDDDATVNLFYATRKMRFVGGSYKQSVDATAVTSYTATIEVGTQQLSQDLDIKTLDDATVGYFLPSATSTDRDIAKGDLVEVNFNQTGGTATSPEVVDIMLEFQLIE